MIKKTNSIKIKRKMQIEPLKFESDANIDPLCYQFLFINLYGLRIVQNNLLMSISCILCDHLYPSLRIVYWKWGLTTCWIDNGGEWDSNHRLSLEPKTSYMLNILYLKCIAFKIEKKNQICSLILLWVVLNKSNSNTLI